VGGSRGKIILRLNDFIVSITLGRKKFSIVMKNKKLVFPVVNSRRCREYNLGLCNILVGKPEGKATCKSIAWMGR
jgi:hypothetical protein